MMLSDFCALPQGKGLKIRDLASKVSGLHQHYVALEKEETCEEEMWI